MGNLQKLTAYTEVFDWAVCNEGIKTGIIVAGCSSEDALEQLSQHLNENGEQLTLEGKQAFVKSFEQHAKPDAIEGLQTLGLEDGYLEGITDAIPS